MKNKNSGYTLIEILIVLFIISIVTATALLSINHNSNRTMETFAKQLTQTITLAEEQALLQPATIGILFEGESFRFLTLKQKQWMSLQDSVFSKHSFPNGIQVSVKLDVDPREHADSSPQIIISTNGEATPFTIYIGKAGEKPRYIVRGEADGSVSHTALT